MEHILNNPVWHALLSGNSHLALGTGPVRYLPAEVSPFAALKQWDAASFDLLAASLPPKSTVALVTAQNITIPGYWRVIHQSQILQMVGENPKQQPETQHEIVDLGKQDIAQMLVLTKMTQPGPFAQRTIEFGNYAGIFDTAAGSRQLIAMAGRRMHAEQYIEISAICTHPNHTGKGLGRLLTLNRAQQIVRDGGTPFLHVRKENDNAIKLYQNVGFVIRSEMYLNVIKTAGTAAQ